MSLKNYWIKNGLLNIMQNMSGVLFGFVNFFILVRILSKDDFGLWVIFVSLTGIVEFAKNGLTQEATIKYLSSADERNRKQIITATFAINMVISAIVILLTFFFAPFFGKLWHSNELILLIRLYTIVFLISSFLNQLNCIEQAKLNFKGVFYSTVSRQFFFFLFIVTFFLAKKEITLLFLTIALIIVTSIATFIAYIFTKKDIQYSKDINYSWVKKILNFGKYSFGISLSSVLSNSIDQMMLGSMLSKSASGSFNVAVRVTSLADIPVNSMANIVYPQSAKRVEQEGVGALKYLYEKSIGVVLSILLPALVGAYLLSDYLIVYIAGAKYADAIPLLHVTLLGCLFSPYGRQAGTILAAAGKTRINFYIILSSTCFLIVLNYFLIKEFGVLGAAYATLISTILTFTITQIILKRLFGISVFSPWKYAFQFYPEFYNNYWKQGIAKIRNKS